MYGKIINGKLEYAPESMTIGEYTFSNFNEDINLMTAMGYKEIVNFDVPEDVRFRYIYSYEERDGKIYESRELDTSEELLDDLKARRIAQTKIDLAKYIEENPLEYERKLYTVTIDKQNQLTSVILNHLLDDKQDIYWNAKGETSTKWAYEDICNLKKAIDNYIFPIVEYQRHLEDVINRFDNQEDIIKLNCYFSKDKIDKYTNS